MKQVKEIWGAGLSGLIAAQAFQEANILESRKESALSTHKALLRFRTAAVGEALGIPFRAVRVHKGLWDGNGYVSSSILHANFYARKVVGRLADRSVWALEPSQRFIAPENLTEQLLARFRGRIAWDCPVDCLERRSDGDAIVSTLPMHVLADLLQEEGHDLIRTYKAPEFHRQAIGVMRYRVKDCDVHQTVYNVDPTSALYRVSITTDLLIAEYVIGPGDKPKGSIHLADILRPFGLSRNDVEDLDGISQNHGKIAPIDEAWRRRFVFEMSQRYGIYALGRFATWRNILLDDVLQDVNVIRRLVNSDGYEARLGA